MWCRDVAKSITSHKALAVIVGPNIEQTGEDGGVDDQATDILNNANEANVPVIFALSREELGKVSGNLCFPCLACNISFPLPDL